MPYWDGIFAPIVHLGKALGLIKPDPENKPDTPADDDEQPGHGLIARH